MRDLVNAGMAFLTSAGPGLTAFFDGLRNAFSQVDFAALGKSFGNMMKSLGNIDPTTIGVFTEALKFMFDTITRLVNSGLLNRLIDLLSILAGVAATILQPITLAAEAIGWLGRKLGFGGDQAEAASQRIGESMGKIANDTTVKSNAAANKFGSNIGKLPPAAGNAGRGAANGLNRGLSPMPGFAGNQADEARRRAIEGLRRAEPEANSAGRSIMQGLINGMRSMGSSVISSAVSVAVSAFQAAKRALGISSPSKLFMQLGTEISRGLIEGILRMTRQVALAGDQLAMASMPRNLPSWHQGILDDLSVDSSATVHATTSLDVASLQALAAFIIQGLTGSELKVDGRGVAQLVNNFNIRDYPRVAAR